MGVLAAGFVVGGLLHELLSRFLPQGPAREVFTLSKVFTIGPFHVDLLVVSLTLGPLAVDASVMAVLGVVAAYFVARSLF